MKPPLPEIECGVRNAEFGTDVPDSRRHAKHSAPRAPNSEFRVAHVLRKLDPAAWGGTETAIQRLVEGLREHAVESTLFCPRLPGHLEREPLDGDGCVTKRFRSFLPVAGLSPARRRQLISVGGNLMSLDLPAALWREPVALIHTHALGRLGGVAARIAQLKHLPLVVTIHGGYLDLPPAVKTHFAAARRAGFEWGKLFALLLPRTHQLLQHADAILTCNPNEARLLREQFPRQRVQIQPHGIPVALYEHDCRAAAREAFPQIPGRDVLLCVGRIDGVKNQGWLVAQAPDIFRRHPRALLILAGAITDEIYGENLQRQIRRFNLERKIQLTGGLPPGDTRLIGLFQEARAVILPSVSETFGLVLLEAWAAGTPVISSGTSGARALVRHGENGWLFDLEDPAGFHNAVDALLGKPHLQKQFAAAGKNLAARYSVRAVAARVKNLYAELMEEKHAPRHFAGR